MRQKLIAVLMTEDQVRRMARGLGELRIAQIPAEAKILHGLHMTLRDDRLNSDDHPMVEEEDELRWVDLRSVL